MEVSDYDLTDRRASKSKLEIPQQRFE
nr:translation initiation factor 1 [Carallia brachiata]UKZ50995.1 translation initiation factor 1 [Carallia brachiata]